MAGICALSIRPDIYKGDFISDLFYETFYQQHLGEEYSGLSTMKNREIKIRTHRGLFRSSFANDLEGLGGTEGIGYCGHTREPYFTNSRLGKFSLCFSGNIINLAELISRFKNFGHTFEREDDIEIIAKLIAQGRSFVEGIKIMANEVKGAYSLLILTEEGIYVVRDPFGRWPLVFGEKEGAAIIASETVGFENRGFSLQGDIRPGEIIFLQKGHRLVVNKIASEKTQFCSFVWVYTAFVNDVFEGIPVSLVRRRLGAMLARRDIEEGFIPDMVAPVPDSGRFHAIGYFEEFCRQMMAGKIERIPLYNEVLLKYPYAGRSYTPQTQEARDLEAQLKIVSSGETYPGKEVVICDDSIVRGTQIGNNLVPKLRSLKFRKVHVRISNPELRSHCPWGKSTQRGEVLAARMPSVQDRVGLLGIDSLKYNTIDDLVEAIGLPRENLCVDCDLGCD
jgi:amidophosphoribosyltransferase